MSWKDAFKRKAREMAEEGAAEHVVTIAVEKLGPHQIPGIVGNALLVAALASGVAGWYLEWHQSMFYAASGIAAVVGVGLHALRIFIVRKLTGLLLRLLRFVKDSIASRWRKKTEESSGGGDGH